MTLALACVWYTCRRHKIIESPKAGRYAQLWCRTCCNCTISGKQIGNLVGCTNTAHWHTVTNRSYHEKTPFHQLANNLLQSSYSEALQARIPFEDAIGLTGQTYYKMVGEKSGDLDQAARRGEAKGGEHANGGRGAMKRERAAERHEMVRPDMIITGNSNAFQGMGRGDPPLLRGMHGSGILSGILGTASQAQIHQVSLILPPSLLTLSLPHPPTPPFSFSLSLLPLSGPLLPRQHPPRPLQQGSPCCMHTSNE